VTLLMGTLGILLLDKFLAVVGLETKKGGAVHMPPHKPLLPKRQMRSEERETHPPGDLLSDNLPHSLQHQDSK
jgi:hypothetical protein